MRGCLRRFRGRGLLERVEDVARGSLGGRLVLNRARDLVHLG